MLTNVGQIPISIGEELSDVTPEAAGWFAWARAASPDYDAEAQRTKRGGGDDDDAENWVVVEPGKVVAFWPSPRNKNLQLKARCGYFFFLADG